jgi:hypothetical protein
MPLRCGLGYTYGSNRAAISGGGNPLTLAAILCHNNEMKKDEEREVRSANSTPGTAATTNEDELGNNGSEGSSTDGKIIQFFINDIITNEEPSPDEQLREKKNKHRLHNIRHRQRKQLEVKNLRKTVEDLEKQLKMLQKTTHMRLYIDGPNQWEELMKAEKQKREEAEEEFDLLQTTVDGYEKLLQHYCKAKNSMALKIDESLASEKQ